MSAKLGLNSLVPVYWVCVALLALFQVSTAFAQTLLPSGFTDTLVASVPSPTALAFTPDGRMLVTTKDGRVRVIENGTLLSTAALTLGNRVCTQSERGLLGIAVDPNFQSNGYVYLFYTFNKSGCQTFSTATPFNRVSRFTMSGNTLNIGSETVLIDGIYSYGGNHNAGDLHVGGDGLLYISTGDAGTDYGGSGSAGANDAARERHHLLGKILRINLDGSIPGGNPYSGANTARCNLGPITPGQICQEIYAWGLRNPFRIAFDPNSAGTRFFINDVGQNHWEEIDIGQAGADYGWNIREGFCANGSASDCIPPGDPAPPGLRNPLFAYNHDQLVPGTGTGSCKSITGGAFVPNGVWPAEYDGAYLFSDYVCGAIFSLKQNGSTATVTDFVRNLGSFSATHLRFGPFSSTQALYYTTFAGGGQVRRIAFASVMNQPPTAVISATPTAGATPLTVNFSAAGSGDPNPGDTLTYFWNFGDNTPEQSGSSPTIQHIYAIAGTYTATLRARDSQGAFSAPASIEITAGNQPPQLSLTSPSIGQTYAVGQVISLIAGATDPEDGALPASSITWTVILHHDTHTHPFLGPQAGNNLNFAAPAPEDLEAATNSFLEIRARAVDSAGAFTEVVRNIEPRKVNLTFNTEPPGLSLLINNTTVQGGSQVVSWENFVLALNAPAQSLNGVDYDFESWADGAPRNRTIVTPASPAVYTARFQQSSGTGLTTVSAGSFQSGPIAQGSIVSGFGQDFAPVEQDAASVPLPTELQGISVRVRDADGNESLAPLFFVSPEQINFLIEDSVAVGSATLEVLKNGVVIASESITITTAAPSIFTANQDGMGVPAGETLLVQPDGDRITLPVFSCTGTPSVCEPAALDFGSEGGELFLTLYATGLRNRPPGASVRVLIAGIECEVTFAGPQPEFVGLDQVNVKLPPGLRGLGLVELILLVNDVPANTVKLQF